MSRKVEQAFAQCLAYPNHSEPRSCLAPRHKWFQYITWFGPLMVTIEEDLEMLAKSLEMGIDPFPPPKPKRPWARYAIASFLSILMISWVSKFLMRFT